MTLSGELRGLAGTITASVEQRDSIPSTRKIAQCGRTVSGGQLTGEVPVPKMLVE